MAFVENFLIPLVEVTFLLGVVGTVGYFVVKAFHNAWTKSWKFVWKYKIMKKKYPETPLKWVMDAFEGGIGWYDAKKLLMTSNTPITVQNEILWIYDEIIILMNGKGGDNKDGRKPIERHNSKFESETKLPSF